VQESRNQGVPLVQSAPRSKVQQSIVGLAQALTGKSPGPNGKEKARGWATLFSRK
jgi:Flp pilus assembly CpaE family ATPase